MSGKNRDSSFEIEKFLGGGAFADTYLARVLDLKKLRAWGVSRVALKIPKDKDKELTLIREFATSSHVTSVMRRLAGSENVVRYLDIDRFDERYVMVMEYVEGGSLRDVLGPIDSQRPLPVPRALDVAMGILAGLEAIHGAGVFHRDIKPENVMMGPNGPKIADLGIATMLLARDQASTMIGTLAYMAPELLSGRGAGFPADIWSAGVTFYEMLTGRWPFGGGDTAVGLLIDEIRKARIEAPSSINPSVPAALDSIVMKALSKSPDDRYASAAAMSRDLAAFRENRYGAPVERARPEGPGTAKTRLHVSDDGHPDTPGPAVLRERAEFLNRNGRYREAVELLRKAVDRFHEEPLLCWTMALSLQKIGKVKEACELIDKALERGLGGKYGKMARLLLRKMRKGSG